MNKRYFATILCILMCLTVWCALPETGKYYRIVNANYGTAITENYTSMTAICTAKGSTSDYEQIWKVVESGSKTGLQNVYTGHYIQPQDKQSTIFATGNSIASVTFSTASDDHLLMHCGGYMHCDASANVVNWWDTSAEGNHWTLEEVKLDAAKAEAARADYENLVSMQKNASSYNTILEKYFTDYSCSALKSEYASMSDADLKAEMSSAGLPAAIQDIAVKVKNSWSNELNAEMSKQFRVQDYEAYSVASMWRWNSSDGRGLNASQINDMNNPTGIYTTSRSVLYVFVDGDVPADCELRFAGCTEGTGGCDRFEYQAGTTLKKGMNVIAAGKGLTEYWVMYALTNKTKKPADMPKLKIHVEGGNVMGYVNAQNKDETATNAEYEKVLKAANASADKTGADKMCLRLAVKGNYGMFYWQIDTYNQIWATKSYNGKYPAGYRIYKSMLFYDNVLKQEWGLMGFTKWVHDATKENPVDYYYGGQDLYPTYCNNLAITLMGTNGGNPYSTTGYTHMPGVGAVESSYNAERADFDTWCVGHESGHNNQGSINLESSTESSNNTFSNIITFMQGYRMSRGGTFADNEANFQNNVVFGKRDIGMTMRMYYNLYLYYHLAGNKQDFFPTLFVNLRKDPIIFGGNGLISGPDGNLNSHHAKTTWLHFYKKACEAAQEDLTEYFRLWGFFVPVDKMCFGDYTSYYVTSTQEEIDEAIAWVKAKGWKENKQILFIEDRLQTRERTDLLAGEASGSQKMKPDNGGTWRTDEWLKDYYGTLGDVYTFGQSTAVKGDYTYIASGQSITASGKGGVGFLVYDTKGNIVAHANTLKFNIPINTALEGYSIKVINADGTETEVKDAGESGTPEQIFDALKQAVEATTDFTSLIDESGNKVGFYSSKALEKLTDLVAQANTAITNKESDKYATLRKDINNEMLRLKTGDAMNTVKPTGLYTIYNQRERRYMQSDNNGALINTVTDSKANATKWAFVPDDNGNYYLENYDSKLFVSDISAATASEYADAYKMAVVPVGDGSFYLTQYDNKNKTMNCDPNSHNVVSWSADAGSQWIITLYSEMDEYTDEQLKNLVKSTNDLVDKICTIEEKESKLDLQTTDKSLPYYISTNMPNDNYPIKNLVDGNAISNFYTDDTNNKQAHYIQVDCGSGNGLQEFYFKYRTSSKRNSSPKTMEITAGTLSSIVNSEKQELSDLPSGSSKQVTYTSEHITFSKAYRYIRFKVTATNDSDNKYPHFAMADFWIYAKGITYTMHEGYEGVSKTLIEKTKTKVANTEETLKGSTSVMINLEAYTALKNAYDALNTATSTDIIDIAADKEATSKTGIYDMSGRRIKEITKAGVYIVDGKKVMIK